MKETRMSSRDARALTRGPGARRRLKRPASVTFPEGSNLFDPPHPCRQIYWLRSGRLQLSADHEATLDLLTRGDFFGIKNLLTSRRIDQVAKALSPAEVVVFRKRDFLKRLRQDPRFAWQVLSNIATRIDRYEEAIREFVTEPAARRLAHALLRFAPPHSKTGWVQLAANPSNLELARMVGTTRWRVSHFLNDFQRQGWLRRQNELWVQLEGLQAFLRSTARSRQPQRYEPDGVLLGKGPS